MDFMHYWQISDIVTKSLFFLLLALSIFSWVTGIVRVIQSRKLATIVADDLTQQIAAKRSELVMLMRRPVAWSLSKHCLSILVAIVITASAAYRS